MKLRKLLILILVVGLLAVYYILGTGYREQRHQNAVLAAHIAEATQQLALIPPAPADLERRQAAASADLDAVNSSLPTQLNSTQIINSILKLAEETKVKAIPLITQPWATESVIQTDFRVFRLNIAVKGTFAQLADFVNRLENGEPATLVITNLVVDRVTGPSDGEGETGDTMPVDASLDIAVYARTVFAEPPDKVKE